MLNRRNSLSCILIIATVLFCWNSAAWTETVAYDGLIEPYVIVDIGAPVPGIVAKVMVDRSGPVTKGQPLVEMESSVERAAVEKAKAMAALDGDIGLQQTQLALAKRVYERIENLKAVSVQDKDQAGTEIVLTQYRLKQAQENRALAGLELGKALAALARLTIQSPISGVVINRYVSPGQYVNSNPLLRVAQIHPLRIEVIVPDRLFNKITPGMTATVIPELEQYGAQTATVTLVDKVIDSASSTFGVRLELPNTEQTMPSGLRCLVRFEIEDIPKQARK